MSPPSRAPGNADRKRAADVALVEQLQSALRQGRRATIVDAIRCLAEAQVPMGSQWRSLAQIAAENGELSLARRALDIFVGSSGAEADARYQAAAVLAQADAWSEAYDLLVTLPETVPDPTTNAYSRGMGLLNIGRADEARAYLAQVVRERPELGAPWLALAMSADLSREERLADSIVAAEAGMARAPASERARYYYALGKAHADREESERAFAAFSQGARDMRSLSHYSREGDRALAAEAIEGFDRQSIGAIARGQTEATGRTIFVTGLPRSGTTLVQQILTAHSGVGGGAETGRLALLAKDIGGVSHARLADYVAREGATGAARIWDHWMAELFPGADRVVEKTTNSSRMLGIAAALLPEAPLIWITRDPLDRAWSCFRTNFLEGAMPWSYDLADIAFHFRLEERLLAQWQGILGERLLLVSYEDLASDSAPVIRRILAHCGLAEEPGVFAPHQNRSGVSTASLVQVRRPINREAIGAAQPYRQFLQPFVEAYAA